MLEAPTVQMQPLLLLALLLREAVAPGQLLRVLALDQLNEVGLLLLVPGDPSHGGAGHALGVVARQHALHVVVQLHEQALRCRSSFFSTLGLGLGSSFNRHFESIKSQI